MKLGPSEGMCTSKHPQSLASLVDKYMLLFRSEGGNRCRGAGTSKKHCRLPD